MVECVAGISMPYRVRFMPDPASEGAVGRDLASGKPGTHAAGEGRPEAEGALPSPAAAGRTRHIPSRLRPKRLDSTVMSNLFDDFLRELERRRSEAEGRTSDHAPRRRGGRRDRRRGRRGRRRRPTPTTTPTPTPPPPRTTTRPTPATTSPSRSGRAAAAVMPAARRAVPRLARPVGGPDDGAGSITVGGILRRMGVAAFIIIAAVVVLLAGIGVDLWTDAIWYESVGFDGVFWTRLGAQVGLFVVGVLAALVVLLGNLWLAGRLAPPPDPERPGRLRTIAGRALRGPAPGRAQRPHERWPGRSLRPGPGRAVRRRRPQRPRRGGHVQLRGGRHAGPHADGVVGHRRLRAPARPRHRRRDLGRLGDAPAVGRTGSRSRRRRP